MTETVITYVAEAKGTILIKKGSHRKPGKSLNRHDQICSFNLHSGCRREMA